MSIFLPQISQRPKNINLGLVKQTRRLHILGSMVVMWTMLVTQGSARVLNPLSLSVLKMNWRKYSFVT